MVVQETVTDELECDGGLADTAVAEHNNLVYSEAARSARSLARHSAACLRGRRRRPRRAGRSQAAPAPVTRPQRAPLPSPQPTAQRNHCTHARNRTTHFSVIQDHSVAKKQ